MVGERAPDDERDALTREVVALRLRVAELQRAAARHEETPGISLPEREELLREAERIAHLGTWTWDLATGRVTWSDELYRIMGYAPGGVTPSVELFFAAVHPEDRERVRSASEQSLTDGVLPLVDCRIIRPDGTIRQTTSSSSMLFDANQVLRRMVGGVLDRTDSLEVENKLRRTLALLEEAQRFARLGNWRFDPRSGELEWSQEFRRIAGLPLDVVPDPDLFLACVVPEDRARFRAIHEKSLEQPSRGEGLLEVRLQRPDGEIRHVRTTTHTIERPDGSTELRGTMLDITDQVRLREELVHSQKMEAVGRLAGGIAHDFNNLLTVITANLELLSGRIGSCQELDISLQALSSASSLTRRLLAFGRKAQLSLKLVAINAFVRSTMALMQRLVGDEVRLELDLAPELPQVRMDPLEMERALVNLVVNARDAMPGGGVVRISTALLHVEGAPHVALSVADQGAGIAEADRPHIFEPFFTTREDAGGTGLGLATVLGTAEQHGGTVDVKPRPGGGTIFSIVLPGTDAPAEPEAQVPEKTPSAQPTRPLNLLVIDDDVRVAEVTRRILSMRGHVVRAATQPSQVLSTWAEHGATTDLVICDVAMALMRGPELIARLSEIGRRPRVLFITGYSEELVHAELGHPVLSKPFTAETLLRAVHDALRQ